MGNSYGAPIFNIMELQNFPVAIWVLGCIDILIFSCSFSEEVAFPQLLTPPTPGSGHQWTLKQD